MWWEFLPWSPPPFCWRFDSFFSITCFRTNWNSKTRYGGPGGVAPPVGNGTYKFCRNDAVSYIIRKGACRCRMKEKNWKSRTCWMIFSSMPWWHILKWERSLHERFWNFCLTRSFEIWKLLHRNPMGDWIRISTEDPLLSCHHRQPQSEIRRGFWKVKESIRNLYL